MSETTGAGGTLRDDELIMAVIEAAEARHNWIQQRWGKVGRKRLDHLNIDLHQAVEALQEARDATP